MSSRTENKETGATKRAKTAMDEGLERGLLEEKGRGKPATDNRLT